MERTPGGDAPWAHGREPARMLGSVRRSLTSKNPAVFPGAGGVFCFLPSAGRGGTGTGGFVYTASIGAMRSNTGEQVCGVHAPRVGPTPAPNCRRALSTLRERRGQKGCSRPDAVKVQGDLLTNNLKHWTGILDCLLEGRNQQQGHVL